jgi:hypothetical protein
MAITDEHGTGSKESATSGRPNSKRIEKGKPFPRSEIGS